MGLPNIFKVLAANNSCSLASSNTAGENLLQKRNAQRNGFESSAFWPFRHFLSGKKIDGGSRTEEEEKVYAWLYTLAQSEKDIVFEYVRSTERGLSFTEADRRLKENGPNIPHDYTFPKWWHLLWSAFFHPFNIILLVLSFLSFLAVDKPNGCIMLVLVFISVSLRFYQEYSSSKAAMKLSEFLRCPVKVQRCAGKVVQTELLVQVDQRDIVPGDIIVFEPGDLFPGDVRLLTSKQLCGTSVISGSGTGLVVSTGSKTYMSTMFLNVRKQKPPDEFEKGIRYISFALITVMLIASIIMVLADYVTSHILSESIIFGISVASALTPQMLPLIVNTSLAKGALAMARDRCILKSLTAIRDMGSMDILCIDKTGTLTMNHAIMVNHLDSWGSPKEKVLHFGFLNAYFKAQQKYPLDDAIMSYAYTNGYRFQPSRWTKIEEIAFDFTRRRVSVILEKELNVKDRSSQILNRIVITKGAPEEVINLCSFIEHIDRGEIGTLSVEEHRRIQNIVEDLSNNGLRVLAVAMKRLEMDRGNRNAVYDNSVECNMVFLGLISFFDPPKDTAKQALWRLADKGVQAKVLTGDSLHLAIRICKEVGIETTHVVTGPDLELLNHDSFHETVKTATVFARLTPTLKLRVVQSLQTVGKHVVGFLGDGVNDSLALDAANVGISVDLGTSIAKDLADIILLEKDLNVLVAGVEHGRLTFANTMKYIKMSVIANIGSILSLLIATLVLGFEPLTPRQLLTQYFLYNFGQIAIPWDNMKEDYVKTPQKWSLKGLAVFTLWNAPVCTLADASSLLFIWFYYKLYASMQISIFRSAWFVEGLLMQTLIIHMIRTEKIPFIQEVASWPVICSTVVISAIGISIPYTPIGSALGFTPLPSSYFVFLFVLFVGYFTVGQLVKRSYILVYKTWL